jgi:hypothetical protein
MRREEGKRWGRAGGRDEGAEEGFGRKRRAARASVRGDGGLEV